MIFQLDLFEDDFLKYHRENPQIYEAFKQFTTKAIERGHKNWSAEAIFNVMRWETGIEGNDEFKINNNYKALYARLFMRDYPKYAGFFRIRKSQYDVIWQS